MCCRGESNGQNLGISSSRVVLEKDAALVKAAVEGEEYRLSALGGLISELHILLFAFRVYNLSKYLYALDLLVIRPCLVRGNFLLWML
jgi:hypothetical protein